jgi:hypothetical protein
MLDSITDTLTLTGEYAYANDYDIRLRASVGEFIQEKVGLKNSLSQSEGGGGGCPSRETGCGGQRPQVEASSKYMWEKRCCVRARKGSYEMVEIKLLCFRWLSPFFKGEQKGFSGFA